MNEDPIANLLALTDCQLNWGHDTTPQNDTLGSYSSDLFAFSGPDLGFDEHLGVPADPGSSDRNDAHVDAPSISKQPLSYTPALAATPADSTQAATVSSLTGLDYAPSLNAPPTDSAQAPAMSSLTEHSRPDPDSASRQQSLPKSRYDDESKLQKNREAQRRFRQRHKAKSQSAEQEIASQRAELKELRQRQQQLEARNVLLERLSHINQQQQQLQYAAMDRGNPNHGDYSAAAPFVSKGPLLTLTIKGRSHVLTHEEIQHITFPQFAALYTDYNRAIGQCFLELSQAGSQETLERMQQLTIEVLTLTGRVMLVPGMHKAVMSGRLDTGGPCLQKPDAAWYKQVLFVLNLSDRQCIDLMYLRRLNLSQRCALSMERKGLMAQMLQCEAQALTQSAKRSENLYSVAHLAACLQKNTSEDRLVYYQLARALYRGVLTTEQLAEGILQSYPFIAVVETLLDTLAASRGEPTKEEIVAAAQLKPQPSEWHHFVQYVQQFERGNVHEYVPVLRH